MGPPPLGAPPHPPRMFGMPPPVHSQSLASMPPAMGGHMGAAVTGQSKIDPNQIPRPIPSSSVVLHETRHGNQANPPPVSCDPCHKQKIFPYVMLITGLVS